MQYAVINKDGEFTGATYTDLDSNVTAHHEKYGHAFAKVRGLKNEGTNEAPLWVELPAVEAEKVSVVTMRQARLALHRNGLLNAAITAIDTLPEPAGTEAQIEWEYALSVERQSPIVQMIKVVMGLTDQQVDDMFDAASIL